MLRRTLSIVGLALLLLAAVGIGLLSLRGAQSATRSSPVSLPIAAPAESGADLSPVPIEAAGGWQPLRSPALAAGLVLAGCVIMAVVAAFTGARLFEGPHPPRAILLIGAGVLAVVLLGVCMLVTRGLLGILGTAAPRPTFTPEERTEAPAATETVTTEPTGPTEGVELTETQPAGPTEVGSAPTFTPTTTIIDVTPGPSGTPTREATEFATGAPQPTRTPAAPQTEQAVVEVEWPARLEVSDSGEVRVSLIRTAAGEVHLTVEAPGNVGTSFAIPSPAGGTPGAALSGAFGAGYQGSVSAALVAGGFKIAELSPGPQPLDQPRSDFVWSITPDGQPGRRTLLVSLDGRWKPVGGQGEDIHRPLWRGTFAVEVTRPLIATGQLDLMTLFADMIGSVLSVPWLYERFKDIRAGRKRQSRKPAASK